jgi:prepilin-type N-terminal cleavage/methylation domain-containing protein
MNFNYNRKKGMSLFELLITTMLLSILLSMGFHSFDSSVQDQNAVSAAEQMISAINKTKYYSRSKGVVASLSFPIGSNTYSISADNVVISNSNFFDASSGKLPKNVEIIQNTCIDINFYVDGSLVDSSGSTIIQDCKITVGYESGPQKTIVIRGNSGNVDYE